MLLASSTSWGPVLFATLVPMSVAALGGLIKLTSDLARVRQQVSDNASQLSRIEHKVETHTHGSPGRARATTPARH